MPLDRRFDTIDFRHVQSQPDDHFCILPRHAFAQARRTYAIYNRNNARDYKPSRAARPNDFSLLSYLPNADIYKSEARCTRQRPKLETAIAQRKKHAMEPAPRQGSAGSAIAQPLAAGLAYPRLQHASGRHQRSASRRHWPQGCRKSSQSRLHRMGFARARPRESRKILSGNRRFEDAPHHAAPDSFRSRMWRVVECAKRHIR